MAKKAKLSTKKKQEYTDYFVFNANNRGLLDVVGGIRHPTKYPMGLHGVEKKYWVKSLVKYFPEYVID